MKVIPVIGYSGSGKTFFIDALVEKIAGAFPGKVAVIKHLGHHLYKLDEGKDTSTYYEHGAAATAGIDAEKAIVTFREGTYEQMLNYLADCGIKYTIIEGFKEKGYRKIVLGDLEDAHALMRNPTVDEVAGSLDKFGDYFTMQGLVRELKEEADMRRTGAILTYTGIVRELTGEEITEYMDFEDNEAIDAATREIENRILAIPGIQGARLYHRRGRLYPGDDVLYIAIAASHRVEGFKAMMEAIDEFKTRLH